MDNDKVPLESMGLIAFLSPATGFCGPSGASVFPVESGLATLEHDNLPRDFVLVNWRAIGVFRIITDD